MAETNDENDSIVQLSQVSSEDDDDDDVASQTDTESTSRTVTVPALGTTHQNENRTQNNNTEKSCVFSKFLSELRLFLPTYNT